MQEDDWIVSEFSAEKAAGKLRSPSTGREVAFPIERWVPCDPATARALQDSDRRRGLLFPQPGEPVDVSWMVSARGEQRLARVSRRDDGGLPVLLPFLPWLERLGQHVGGVAGWTAEEWRAFGEQSDEDFEDTVRSTEPADAASHLGLLAWLKANGPADIVGRRLAWLRDQPGPGRVEAEASDATVFLELPPDVVRRLDQAQLIVLCEGVETRRTGR